SGRCGRRRRQADAAYRASEPERNHDVDRRQVGHAAYAATGSAARGTVERACVDGTRSAAEPAHRLAFRVDEKSDDGRAEAVERRPSARDAPYGTRLGAVPVFAGHGHSDVHDADAEVIARDGHAAVGLQCVSGSNEFSRLVARCETLGLLAASATGLT